MVRGRYQALGLEYLGSANIETIQAASLTNAAFGGCRLLVSFRLARHGDIGGDGGGEDRHHHQADQDVGVDGGVVGGFDDVDNGKHDGRKEQEGEDLGKQVTIPVFDLVVQCSG